MQLAIRIRKIRDSNKLTQEELACRCNMSPSAYGQIERRAGNASYDTLYKVAKALYVTVLFLLDFENPNYVFNKNKL